MDVLWVDDFEGGFGWGLRDGVPRTAHGIVVDGGVWLIDPVDVPGLDERIHTAGEPRGVVQLLDRHGRDCRVLAERYGVPHVGPSGAADTPFSLVDVVSFPGWRERALWWETGRVLAVGDALGTLPYFLAPGDVLGVHPFLRMTPPKKLRRLEPLHVLVGHGKGVHGEGAPAALRRALDTSRRRLPAAFANGARYIARSVRR